MYNLKTLKEKVSHTADQVECPVRGCRHTAERQKKHFVRDEKYLCPTHQIFLSPTTFEYSHYTSNLLSDAPEDLALLEKILVKKRENRLARSNSEDAVTWNSFRYLEKNNLLPGYLASIGVSGTDNAKIHYWCFDERTGGTNPLLLQAHKVFGERSSRGSEPDVLLETDGALIIIECKTGSGNNTMPSRASVEMCYTEADDKHYDTVFRSDFTSIAVGEKKYELLRFWLLGTWMAKQKGKRFYLINLVRDEKEREIESQFGKHIVQTAGTFKRATWEDMHRYIQESNCPNQQPVLSYLQNQTLGYSSSGRIRAAYKLG
ncbi:hypothetical protein ACFQPF_06725 [Fictibacillus iocasae]|uniref:Uncharacterized protein n=1 Tax=Fictibacillus iocasae TaxID=2715437 RepID=A0ABW2NQX2_9BACL